MKLSEIQIQSLLDQHLRQSLNDDEERRLSANRIDRDDLDDELETISFIKSDLKEELASIYLLCLRTCPKIASSTCPNTGDQCG